MWPSRVHRTSPLSTFHTRNFSLSRLAVTIQLQTIYMASAKRGVLTASARVIGVEGRVATCEGEVRLDDGTLCATGSGSFLYLHGSEQPDGVPAEMRKRKL